MSTKSSLAKFKKTSSFCKVSFDEGYRWINGIITRTNPKKESIEVFLSARHFSSYTSKTTNVTVKTINGSVATILSGTIDSNASSRHKQSIIVNVNKVMSFNESRKHERFSANYAAVIKTPGNLAFFSALRDISLGGAQFFSVNSFDSDQPVNVEVFLTYERLLHFSGKIVRKQAYGKGYLYGIELESIDDKNKELLEELLEFLFIQQNQLSNELKMFNSLRYSIYIGTALIVILILLTLFFRIG